VNILKKVILILSVICAFAGGWIGRQWYFHAAEKYSDMGKMVVEDVQMVLDSYKKEYGKYVADQKLLGFQDGYITLLTENSSNKKYLEMLPPQWRYFVSNESYRVIVLTKSQRTNEFSVWMGEPHHAPVKLPIKIVLDE
jgi:hypothetical protein